MEVLKFARISFYIINCNNHFGLSRAFINVIFLSLFNIFNVGAATVFVEYDGSSFPDSLADSYSYNDSASGNRILNNGILHMSVAAASGSINNVRADSLYDTDLAIFQFRTRLASSNDPGNGVTPGGVVQIRWGGESGVLLLFIKENELQLRSGSFPTRTDVFSSLETNDFHTYTILKNHNKNVQVYADQTLIFDLPFAEFTGTLANLSGWQSFSNNPSSSTEWDYFNYAIGPDALSFISHPVPLPAAIWLFGTGIIGLIGVSKKRIVV